jgi:4-amino-4-deoxy-L-arabinose transferase-like glycosyltransferase
MPGRRGVEEQRSRGAEGQGSIDTHSLPAPRFPLPAPRYSLFARHVIMKLSKTYISFWVALLVGNAIVLYTPLTWAWLRFPVALALTFILPGWAWLPAFDWMQTRQAIERLVLVIGLSSLLSALALLLVLLVPGPFTETPVLIALDLAILAGLLLQAIARRLPIHRAAGPDSPHKQPEQPQTEAQLATPHAAARGPHADASAQNPSAYISYPVSQSAGSTAHHPLSLSYVPPSPTHSITSPSAQAPVSAIRNPQHQHPVQTPVSATPALRAGASVRNPQSAIVWPSRTVLLILLAIVAVAAFTRLTRLGYAEFHEDELENMRLIVRAYKGEEYAPFLDSKGPIHWLLPAALWYLNGWVNEAIARTPVALLSLLLIPTMYALGRRMSGGRDHIGLLAGGFVALNGFFVALARHVENRSLIVFWGALAIWFAYRYYKEEIDYFLLYVALTLAIGLIAHPNVLFYLPAVAYLIWLKVWRAGLSSRAQWLWLGGAGLLFIGLMALFYVPYLTDPNIGLVYQYFAEERVGESLFYNRVGNMFGDDRDYSSPYHAPILVLLLTWLLARNFARGGRRGWAIFSVFALAIISTVVWPNLWIIGSINLALVPYVLLIGVFILLPQPEVETKVLFLWFSVPFSALLLLAKDANNHVQVAYTGWALLAALAVDDIWQLLSRSPDRHITPWLPERFKLSLKALIVLIPIIVIPLIIYYQYLMFDSTVTAYWQARIESVSNPSSIYNRLYRAILRPRKIISNPRLGGWKVVGYLWETGVLSGDFRSINESFAVPIWYTFQTPRSCYDDPQHYWLRRDWQGWPKEEQGLLDQGYTLTRVILVDHEPKLHLYEKNAPPGEPEILDLVDYRQKFDRLATPARFARAEPIDQPVSLNFGDKLLLRGYSLPQKTARPGDLLPVTVYWEALAPMDVRYRGFVHLIGPDGARRGQHDDDPACRLLTTDMRPGQQSSRQFRVPVDPDTPPGQYSLILGLYDPATSERLPIWDNLTRQSPGDHIVIGQVTVE